MERMIKNWHQSSVENRTIGEKISDVVASAMGSWGFIVVQTLIVIAWLILNIWGWIGRWDPYPFILLNLVFSTQAFYAAPIIMMSQNRAASRDRVQAQADYQTNIDAKREIEELQKSIARIENEKLDKILKLLEEK